MCDCTLSNHTQRDKRCNGLSEYYCNENFDLQFVASGFVALNAQQCCCIKLLPFVPLSISRISVFRQPWGFQTP